jgi:hypothetical protein
VKPSRIASWSLIALSALMALWVGASEWNSTSTVFALAFLPGIVGIFTLGFRDALAWERLHESEWNLPWAYKRDRGVFFVAGVLAPLAMGVLVTSIMVSVIALVTHAVLH